MLDQHVQAEIIEHMVAISTANDTTNCIVQAFNHCTGEAFAQVVQEFFSQHTMTFQIAQNQRKLLMTLAH